MAFRVYARGAITSVWPAEQLTLKSGKQAERRSFSLAANQGASHPAYLRCTVWDDKVRLLDYLSAKQKAIVIGAAYLSEKGKLSIDIEKLLVRSETGHWSTLIEPVDADATPPAGTHAQKETAR